MHEKKRLEKKKKAKSLFLQEYEGTASPVPIHTTSVIVHCVTQQGSAEPWHVFHG